MNALPRKLGLLAAGTAAFCGMTVLVPAAASAATPAAAPAAASVSAWPRCRPAHTGPGWKWHDTRWGGHWDHIVWNRRHKKVDHVWRDKRYCARWDDRRDNDRRDNDRGGDHGQWGDGRGR